MIPIHIGYRGAGFAIGCVIIQFIVRTESFTLWAGTDSACDKEFFAGRQNRSGDDEKVRERKEMKHGNITENSGRTET